MKEKNQFKIFLKGEDKTDSVREFKHIGNQYEVTFNNGKSFWYNSNNVTVIESALNVLPKADECFDYLKNIANEVGIKIEVEKKNVNVLLQNYLKIRFIPLDSMLSAFLSSKSPESTSQKNRKLDVGVIYPFGFNESQKKAVNQALFNSLSIIEGPPGTGKTQTILNIIANVVMRGECVAIISSNNSATKNVFDKLQKSNMDFIAAHLGNTTNKLEFINSQRPLPDMKDWELSLGDIKNLTDTLRLQYEILQSKLLQQQELSSLRQQLTTLEVEEKHFQQYSNSTDENAELDIVRKVITSQKALEMWLQCESYEVAPPVLEMISFIKYLYRYFRFWSGEKFLLSKLIKKYSIDHLILMFQRRFYKLRLIELNQAISKLSGQLELFDFNSKMSEYSKISLQIFRANLARQYAEKKRGSYVLDDLREKSEEFIKDYPVILSTAYSLRSVLANDVMYDYVIVDESSQVDICTGALALSCAKKAVIVGDLRQLSHVVDSKMAKATDIIFEKYNLSEAYRYKNHSLLSSLVKIFPEVPKTLLREHYRCHPKIIEFCNKKFYGGQLVIMTEKNSKEEPLVVYKSVEGNHERNRVNQRQIDMIRNEIIPQLSLNVMNDSLGIITPYRNQTNALQVAFSGMKVKADTVDKFQGQEKEIVILSTVDNEISEFTDNSNRLNVAVSRAIKQLIVVVNDGDNLKDTNIGDLVNYIEYNNLKIVESKINSVFDYLYRSYADSRRDFLIRHKRISEYDSENLMHALIVEVLQDMELHALDVSSHVPLKMIIRDMELMSPPEKKYALNISTHVDFLIYDTTNMSPKLAIEVDGVAFHISGTRQAERDIMKNEIFKKYNLPLIRFKTDGSGEREQLAQAFKNFK